MEINSVTVLHTQHHVWTGTKHANSGKYQHRHTPSAIYSLYNNNGFLPCQNDILCSQEKKSYKFKNLKVWQFVVTYIQNYIHLVQFSHSVSIFSYLVKMTLHLVKIQIKYV